MNKYIFQKSLICLVLLLAGGCQNTSKLESSLADLRNSVESRLDATDRKMSEMDIDSINSEMQQIKNQSTSFQQSVAPEIRQQLQENLDDVIQASKSVKEIESSIGGILADLKQIESESRQFRNLAEQHATQAKEFDKIGDLEETLNSIKFKISGLENDVRKAKQDAASAERKARDAEREARRRR